MSTPTIITFDVTTFRAMFPVYANATTFPDAQLQMYWDMAICYMSDVNYGWLQLANRTLGLNLLTAHLTHLYHVINVDHEVPNLMQTATIDKVSIAVTPPPIPNQWQWWLNQSGYGQQLLAMLQANCVGGFYVAGNPELSAFRTVGGRFGVTGFPW